MILRPDLGFYVRRVTINHEDQQPVRMEDILCDRDMHIVVQQRLSREIESVR